MFLVIIILCNNTITEKLTWAKNEGNPIFNSSFIIELSNLAFPKLKYPRFLIKWGNNILTVAIWPNPVAIAAPFIPNPNLNINT